MTTKNTNRNVRVAALAVGLVLGVIVLAAVAGAGGATTASTVVAQENNSSSINNSQYYNGSKDVANESWLAGFGDANVNSLGRMATRAMTFFIGTGSMDSSGTGYEGALLTGVVMAASMVATVGGLGIGAVGGSVFAVVIGYGMTAVGLAPAWFRILLLFGIGTIAFISLTNVVEAR